jgi:hypothetical protein
MGSDVERAERVPSPHRVSPKISAEAGAVTTAPAMNAADWMANSKRERAVITSRLARDARRVVGMAVGLVRHHVGSGRVEASYCSRVVKGVPVWGFIDQT